MMRAMDAKVVAACRAAFPGNAPGIVLGAPIHSGECHPEPLVRIPLEMLNRHGLIAGATGTGKTKTLQLMAEQISAAGVPVFLADVKGDLSGLAVAGTESPRVEERAKQTGSSWHGTAFPVELLSLTGERGAQLRATVSSFGPLLLSKVLGLNDTQTSVLRLVFKYCDDRHLELVDFSDLRAALEYLTGDGAAELKQIGGISKASVGVLLREMVDLEQQGALAFFGEPDFELEDLLHVERDGRGLLSILELTDVQDKPALFSTFLMWLLARLYNELPEVGDADKPKLVFFFDEAHLLFSGASKAFLEQVEQVVRLVRSKGVGIFFVTQSPKDVPADILGQLGHRVQHALRAFTPDDAKALAAAARTYPKTELYDVEKTLTTLGIGEALVTVLSSSGVPTPPFATRLIPPASRMGPLDEAELRQRLSASAQVKKYAVAVNPESAAEKLAARSAPSVPPAEGTPSGEAPRRGAKPEPSAFEQILRSPVTRTVAGVVARGLMDALLGTRRRRSRS
jgi:DNA double-strand break repair helicase HerA and related ATPase